MIEQLLAEPTTATPTEVGLLVVAVASGFFFYFLPTIIAWARKVRNRWL